VDSEAMEYCNLTRALAESTQTALETYMRKNGLYDNVYVHTAEQIFSQRTRKLLGREVFGVAMKPGASESDEENARNHVGQLTNILEEYAARRALFELPVADLQESQEYLYSALEELIVVEDRFNNPLKDKVVFYLDDGRFTYLTKSIFGIVRPPTCLMMNTPYKSTADNRLVKEMEEHAKDSSVYIVHIPSEKLDLTNAVTYVMENITERLSNLS